MNLVNDDLPPKGDSNMNPVEEESEKDPSEDDPEED